MSQSERFGYREQVYSEWHRAKSIGRYLASPDAAKRLCQIDIDNIVWIEADNDTKEPLALIETARDCERFKPGSILSNLARRSRLPAFVVLYRTCERPNPVNADVPDIAGFRVRRLSPDLESTFREFTCREYAVWLQQLRDNTSRALWREQGFEWGDN